MNNRTQGNKSDESYTVQSVERALHILLAFETDHRELSVGQLSVLLGLPKSTIHRLLATLEQNGFIEQVETTRNYRLGLKLRVLGASVVASRTLESEAFPILQMLLKQCGETVSVSVLDGIETMIVEKMESLQSMRVTSHIGKRSQIHCSGSGKVLLAFQPSIAAEQILAKAPLTRYTDKTITTAQELIEQFPETRRRGFAADDEEIVEGQLCISAPVWNSEGKAFAAITASGPAMRIRGKGELKIAADVIEAADELSRRLGWMGDRHSYERGNAAK
jgi:DNA-binding IclR family transcriptional regulator